ncbi:MAG: hypothetical protein ACRD5H_17555 [Nitrososphaerales archaeon]
MANEQKNGINGKGSDVISLRINHDVAEALKEEARFDHVSLNVLANNVLHNYVKWEKDAKQAGFIPISKDLLTALLQKLDDKDIAEIVNQTKNIIKAQIIFMEKRYELWTVLRWLETRCKVSGFSEKKFYQNDRLTYIIQHDLGWKWSIYVKTLIEAVLEGLVQEKIDCDVSTSMVIFRIPISSAEERAALQRIA